MLLLQEDSILLSSCNRSILCWTFAWLYT